MIEESGKGERTRSNLRDADTSEDLQTIASPLYRLQTLAQRPQWHSALETWIGRNQSDLLATIGDQRLYALAAISSGDFALAQSSGLSQSEITWLAMLAHRHAGDRQRAFRAALDLEPDAYPDHCLVLLEAVSSDASLLAEREFHDHVEKLNPEFPARTILAALTAPAHADLAGAASELDELTNTSTLSEARATLNATRPVRANAFARAATGGPVSTTDLDTILHEFPSISDDLIDAGQVVTTLDPVAASPYLRARTAIARVSTDELRDLDANRELARRGYLSNDRPTLTALADHAPSEASYYVTLDAIRGGEVPDTTPDDDTLKAVIASLQAGRAHPNALKDPSTWPTLGDLITEEDAANHPEQAAVWQLEQALGDIASWRFESALTRARTALKWSPDELVRDEALNIIGFVLHQQGNDDGAITAMEKALEGEYTANLQANIGIIAKDLRPEIAAHHLARLAHEAPTLELKLAAIRYAFNIWTTSSDAWDEDGLVIPDDLLSTLRMLVVAEIPYEDYVPLIQLLSRADDDWLVSRANTDSGPHTNSAARKVYVARASHDPSDYVEALAEVSKQGNEEDWFVTEKTDFVEGLRSMIFSREGSIGPASYAFAAIDLGLELDDLDYVTLASGAAISIFGAIAQDEALPSEKLRNMVVEAKRRAKALDAEQYELVDPLVRLAGDQYGMVVAGFHARIHDEMIEALRTMATQLYGVPRHRVNWSVVDNALRPIRNQAHDSAREVRQAAALVTNDEFKSKMRELADSLETLGSNLRNPRKMF